MDSAVLPLFINRFEWGNLKGNYEKLLDLFNQWLQFRTLLCKVHRTFTDHKGLLSLHAHAHTHMLR
jgi:hypothetical protein